MGVPIDMGALALQNEEVRAVGNMGVNARGDKLDSRNQIVETRSQTVQKQYQKTTVVNPSRMKPHSGSLEARRAKQLREAEINSTIVEKVDLSALDATDVTDTFDDLPEDNDVVVAQNTNTDEISDQASTLKGGLAGAIARSRELRQEKEKSLREIKQQLGPRKI